MAAALTSCALQVLMEEMCGRSSIRSPLGTLQDLGAVSCFAHLDVCQTMK